MNQQQTQKYNSLADCQATANQYNPDWTGYAPFAEPWAAVLALKVILDGLIADQTTPFTAAGQKAIARAALKAATLKSVTALEWLAGSTGNTALYKLAHLTLSGIDLATEAALVGLATKRHELVTDAAYATAIQAVHYDSVAAAALAAAITQFSTAIGQPGAEHDTHQGYTDGIEATMSQIFEILSTQCDPAVATLTDTHPDFAHQWELSREIGNSPARRTRALEVHVDDSATHTPLPDAHAAFSNGPHTIKDKRTAAAGAFYIQSMEPGTYTMQVDRPGYITATVPIVIVGGQKTVITVPLVKQS